MTPRDETTNEETVVATSISIQSVRMGTTRRAMLLVLSGPGVGNTHLIGPHSAVLGRGDGSEVLIPDPGISRQHAKIEVSDDGFAIRDLGSANGTFLDGMRIEGTVPIRESARIQLGPETVVKITLLDALEAAVQERLHEAIFRDVLTGARNRRYLEARLPEEISYATRGKRPFCLLMIDIDDFKSVNDTHGHLAGDHVLRTLAANLLDSVRAEDVVVRYGGEELLILARDLTLEQGCEFAERLRVRAAETPFALPDREPRHITISIGVASLRLDSDRDPNALIARADAALYRAKSRGRNRVEADA